MITDCVQAQSYSLYATLTPCLVRSPGKELRDFIEEQRKFNKELRTSAAAAEMLMSCILSALRLAAFCVWKASLTHGGKLDAQ